MNYAAAPAREACSGSCLHSRYPRFYGLTVMSIRERLQSVKETGLTEHHPAPVTVLHDIPAYEELKARVHQKLLDRVDLAVMESLPPERLLAEIRNLVERLLVEESVPINEAERQGKLKPGGTIVEPTSGNTGIGPR